MAARKGRPPVGSSQHGVPAAPVRPAARGTRGSPGFTRPALAPSMIAAIVLLACVAIMDSSGFVFARWGVTVLGLIVLVFAVRGRTWWAAALMAAVAVCWNPLVTVPIPGQVWAALQILAAALFIVVGIAVKVPRETDVPRGTDVPRAS
ncbi:DUF6804 family protein [Curtobacterium sp. VKM Ac-1393]|uniref:DUF6804 family protein n=1 Tax=Curtobacterium sp. VKM Ac-1393 TaxID=2783814 RepID=UPI001889E105|nr:DUF6804 family protein [Curtobacterium sp. VKM Ac-1393]MBF4607012.1 hypothetical protein [Curtobacterium sp. VKM Ac-1393]